MRIAARVLAGIVAVVAADVRGTAQQELPTPRFEAVSIKRSPPDAISGAAGPMPGGRFVMTNAPIRVLISSAFPTEGGTIIGAPDWVTNENYDISATARRDVDDVEMAAMLRAMLADRFNLVAQYEMREQPVYALVRARADGPLGPRLRRSAADCAAIVAARESGRAGLPAPASAGTGAAPCTVGMSRGVMVSTGFTMAGLARNLSRPAGRIVLDRTGLDGDYEFALEYNAEPSAGLDGPPSLFTALQEQLGLKLEPTRAPVAVVVIDRIERPTPD